MTVRILASVVLAVEALGVAALFGWQVLALFAGDTASVATAIALAVIPTVFHYVQSVLKARKARRLGEKPLTDDEVVLDPEVFEE